MTALIGAVLVAFVAAGSSLLSTGDTFSGLVVMSIGGIGLGTLFAAVQAGQRSNRFDTRDGLTVRQLKTFIASVPWVTDDTKVYVGDQGLNIAGSVFSCLLDGGKSIVIERKAAPGIPADARNHDLF